MPKPKRRPKPPGPKRNYVTGRARGIKPVSFRVSAEERETLQALADAQSISVGEYARRKVLGSP